MLQVVFLERLGDQLGAQLQDSVKSCLQADPAKRPPSSQMQDAFHQIMLQQGWSSNLNSCLTLTKQLQGNSCM